MEKRNPPIERVDFGDGRGPRKLKVVNQIVRDVVIISGKSIGELMRDPFGGYPYLMQALVQAGEPGNVTLNEGSKLIDLYLQNVGTMEELQKMLIRLFAMYLVIERQKPDDEETDPNAKAPEPSSTGG